MKPYPNQLKIIISCRETPGIEHSGKSHHHDLNNSFCIRCNVKYQALIESEPPPSVHELGPFFKSLQQ